MDWPALMRAGLQGLKLAPDQFWALSPAELQLMLGAGSGRAPLLRDGLEALMNAYPDAGKDTTDE
ncbi:phage tail assembly chaperone [Sulfitobacter sp. TSTF-M16]|uniref:Phage tail assembly chaperone n=1 Tax=Sulfitobacter aestuariivivens TaxID=2766981 RepID=A0A927HE33_9RHOB|nr:rcc01693 family protein [Sulfitobacter aestuariivivens]MBD3662934.1 phage tail assembly chaperone [Sulfitobacter aestuariivivens]